MPNLTTQHACPDCDSPMVLRQNKRDGSEFYGCTAYPICKGTRDLSGSDPEEARYFRERNAPWEHDEDEDSHDRQYGDR